MLIIIIFLISSILINFLVYWRIGLQKKKRNSELNKFFKKIQPIIGIISIILIPIINSSFLQPYFIENVSFFRQYWTWFLVIGIILIIIGIKIISLAKKKLKTANNVERSQELLTKGVYEIARHPVYFSWILIYLGITFILDSFIALTFSIVLVILTELLCILEEKHLLMPKFGESYDHYKKKTPYRLISPPYNYILIIMAFIVTYIGFLNFFNF